MFHIFDEVLADAEAATGGCSAWRALPLEDYGLMLLQAPGDGLPKMPADQIQKNWNGAAGLELLRQSVMNVRLFESAYARVRNRGLHNRRILDIGCGWGRLTRLLLKYSDDVFAVDPWFRSLEEFKACGFKTPIELTDYRPESFPFSDIDFAYAFSVFTHTSQIASEALFRATRRSIADDGLFIFTIRPVEFWPFIAARKPNFQSLVDIHHRDGYAHAPQPGNAGSVDYGDTSISLAKIKSMLADTGWAFSGLDRSLSDPYQVFVIAVPAKA